jgi:hypothetical protein
MSTDEKWRDKLGIELEQLSDRMRRENQPATAGCLSIMAGAVYGGFEEGMGWWMMWYVRWKRLVWWLQEKNGQQPMTREEFDRKYPRGSRVASLHTKIGMTVARANECISRAKDFDKAEVAYGILMYEADKRLKLSRKMGDELEKLMETPPSESVDNTPEQQAVLDECQRWLDSSGDKGVDMPKELWQTFYDMFGSGIEDKYVTQPWTEGN